MQLDQFQKERKIIMLNRKSHTESLFNTLLHPVQTHISFTFEAFSFSAPVQRSGFAQNLGLADFHASPPCHPLQLQ